jgi:peptidase E
VPQAQLELTASTGATLAAMAKSSSDRPASVAARIAGAVIGGGGTYAFLRLTGAWGLGHEVAIAISAGMAVAGFLLGAAVWRAVIELA